MGRFCSYCAPERGDGRVQVQRRVHVDSLIFEIPQLIVKCVGVGFIIYGTIPAGNGTIPFEVNTDGVSSGTIRIPGNNENAYDSQFYFSPMLQDVLHTVTITSQGAPEDLPFQFDRIVLWDVDVQPIMATLSLPSDSTSTPTSTSGSSGIPSSSDSAHKSSVPVAAVGGALGGIIAILLVIIIFLLRRSRRPSKTRSNLVNDDAMRRGPGTQHTTVGLRNWFLSTTFRKQG